MSREGEVHITWKDEEWERFATLLDRAAPRANYMHSVDLATLTIRELNDAGARMDRPREFRAVYQARPKILQAFARLRRKAAGLSSRPDLPAHVTTAIAGPAAAPGEDRIVRWDDQEWEEFAALLHAATPQANYLHSIDLATMTIRELNDAGAKMRRPRAGFASVSMSRAKLLAAFARLREKASSSNEQPAATGAGPVGTVRRAPPPSAPPSPLKLDANSRPIASAPADRQQDKPAADLFATVAWDRREWLAIATEIDRMYPGSDYTHRDHLAGLTSEDVAFAQRVLPVERQNRHIKVASFCTLRAQLLQGFNDLKEQRRLQAEAEAQAARQAQEDAERQAKAALSKAAGAPQQQAAPVAINPYEAAFAPLVDLMLGMLVDRMRPMVADAINQALNAPAPAAVPAEAQPTPPAAQAPIQVDAPGREKPLLRIGVFGSEINYAAQLAPHFRNCEFIFVSCDNSNQTESLKNCDYVFVLTKFINHPAMHRVKKLIDSNKFKPVHGSVSDMRRVLTGLLHGRTTSAQSLAAPAFAH
jgi:hypothetical protein